MKNENKTLLSLLLLSTIMLTGCGGGAGAPDTSSLDTDSDGLSDADETTLYRTNPNVADTDGDGYSDFEEIINKNFDATNNNYSFNPLIADVPKLNVSIGVPNFSVDYTTSDGTSNSQSTGYDNSVSTETTNTSGGSKSHEIGGSFATELSASGTVGFGKAETTVGVKLTGTVSDTKSTESNWSSTTGLSSSQSYSELHNTTVDSSITLNSALMSLFVSVDNPGNVAYTLNDLNLSVTMTGHNASGYGIPIGTLSRTPATTIPLAVGAAATGEIYTLDMNLDNYKTLMSNYQDLVITPIVGTNNLGSDSSETNWVNLSDDIAARTAKIVIDYGYARELETYRVATASDAASQGLSFSQVMSDILKIPYTVLNEDLLAEGDVLPTATTSLMGIRGVEMNRNTRTAWLVAHEHTVDSGISTVTEIYTPNVIQNIDNLTIKAGDKLRIVFIQDSDSDKLSDREEFILGSDPLTADTDGDGINDGDEFYGYTTADPNAADPTLVLTSNPVLADSDGDGLNDYDEWTVYFTDPQNADTDGDSASDGHEVALMATCGVCQGPTTSDGLYFSTDTDDDGLTDVEEEFELGTRKDLKDTDGDGLDDSFELGRVSLILADTTGQLLDLRGCVVAYNEKITALNDVSYDQYKLAASATDQCDPLLADSDGDGVNDGAELAGWIPGYPAGSVAMIPSNPFVIDTDGDGLNDDAELSNTGNPLSIDTDSDTLNDGAEIASSHNRSVIIPEVIAVASISKITANQCFGDYSGLFGFSEDQVAFDPNLMPFPTSEANVGYYARIDGTLATSSLWSNLLLRLQPPTEGAPSNWAVNADRGFTNGVDSNGVFQGGTGVEFVNDGGYSYNPLYVGPRFNSEWFSMATDSLDSTWGDTPADMHDISWMLKEQVYHPQHVKIAEGQTLKAWSGHFCKTPRVNANHLQTGGVWERNAANPQDCVAYWASPVNALQKRWSYAKLKTVLTTFDLEETTTLKSGIDPGCSLKVTYDITTIQE